MNDFDNGQTRRKNIARTDHKKRAQIRTFEEHNDNICPSMVRAPARSPERLRVGLRVGWAHWQLAGSLEEATTRACERAASQLMPAPWAPVRFGRADLFELIWPHRQAVCSDTL